MPTQIDDNHDCAPPALIWHTPLKKKHCGIPSSMLRTPGPKATGEERRTSRPNTKASLTMSLPSSQDPYEETPLQCKKRELVSEGP